MQEIHNHVFIEDQYPGVTLGAIALPHGLIQIDSPPAPEDGRSWRAALLSLSTGVERMLINLDGHPDRTLGDRAMDCTIIAHEKTAETFRNRPNTFKAQGEETGADWESVIGLGNIRWAPPEITFTSRMAIEWSNFPVLMEHHPGPTAGACWAILPEAQIVFIGDLVVKNQTPFIASANLPVWLKSLDYLMKNFQDYTIVSGRGGIVQFSQIKNQYTQIETLYSQLEALAQSQAGADAVEKIIPAYMRSLQISSEKQKQYSQRLVYGLQHYYSRHYKSGSSNDESEE